MVHELNKIFNYIDRLDVEANTFEEIKADLLDYLIKAIKDILPLLQQAEEWGLVDCSLQKEQAMKNILRITGNGNDIIFANSRNLDNKCRVAFIVLISLIEGYFSFKSPMDKVCIIDSIPDKDRRKLIYKMKDEFISNLNLKEEIEILFLDSKSEDYDKEKQSPTLPNELDTPKARIVFDKAIEKGYMTPKGNYYQWHLNNVLLAYLCGKLYSGDFIQINKYRKNEYKQGELTFPEEAIENLFYDKKGKPLKYIRKSRDGISGNPRGYKDIDRLFEKATE